MINKDLFLTKKRTTIVLNSDIGKGKKQVNYNMYNVNVNT